jgi:hypothetical protein
MTVVADEDWCGVLKKLSQMNVSSLTFSLLILCRFN